MRFLVRVPGRPEAKCPGRPGGNRTPSPSAALPWPRPMRLRFGVKRELTTRKNTRMVPLRGQNNGHNQQIVLLWHWGAAQRVNPFYFEHPHPTNNAFRKPHKKPHSKGHLAANLTGNLTANLTGLLDHFWLAALQSFQGYVARLENLIKAANRSPTIEQKEQTARKRPRVSEQKPNQAKKTREFVKKEHTARKRLQNLRKRLQYLRTRSKKPLERD